MAHHIAEQARHDAGTEVYLAERAAKNATLLAKVDAERNAARTQAANYANAYRSFAAAADIDVLTRKAVKETIWDEDVKEIGQVCRRIDRKVAKFARDTGKITTGDPVDWPEAVVIRATLHLTALDADHTQEPNHKGWDRRHSSWGHWCCALFDSDQHALAVTVARHICATYVNRQFKQIATEQKFGVAS